MVVLRVLCDAKNTYLELPIEALHGRHRETATPL